MQRFTSGKVSSRKRMTKFSNIKHEIELHSDFGTLGILFLKENIEILAEKGGINFGSRDEGNRNTLKAPFSWEHSAYLYPCVHRMFSDEYFSGMASQCGKVGHGSSNGAK